MTGWQSRAFSLVELTWQAMDGLDQISFEAVSDQRMRLKAKENLERLEALDKDDKPIWEGLIGPHQLVLNKLELVDLSSFEQTPLFS
ncbi:hypothetical protein Tco_1250430 [Tanacetum coccineum]